MDMIKTVLNTPRLREGAIGALGIALGALLCAAIVHAPGASSDWAAWVQAIGSIAAIIGAFAIANQQAIDARKQTHEAMASRTRHLRLVLREIFAATMEQIENIRGCAAWSRRGSHSPTGIQSIRYPNYRHRYSRFP
ncbi:hypothetical protein [Paraburkholderia sp. MM5477-R1]|uniref:hypothetical protein n=1 Tax=Paraburkholderia sp. MM5477-R1 TaxID=2991062 RepID=UPI003D2064C4